MIAESIAQGHIGKQVFTGIQHMPPTDLGRYIKALYDVVVEYIILRQAEKDGVDAVAVFVLFPVHSSPGHDHTTGLEFIASPAHRVNECRAGDHFMQAVFGYKVFVLIFLQRYGAVVPVRGVFFVGRLVVRAYYMVGKDGIGYGLVYLLVVIYCHAIGRDVEAHKVHSKVKHLALGYPCILCQRQEQLVYP